MAVNPLIFAGSSHPELADEVAVSLGTTLGNRDLHLFPDKEIFVEILEEVQGRHVFVLQSFGSDPNIYFMELFIILDALKRASAASLTVVLPYYGYARQDRVDKPGTPITAKLIANLLTCAGTDHLITMDLHSEQIEGFFDIPVEQLSSRTLLIPYCESLELKNAVVVAPDKGGIKIASAYAKQLNLPIALVDKERIDSFRVEMRLFVGDVKGKTVLLPDDMCSTGGTLVNAAEVCARLGAKRIIAVVGHGLFIEDALEKIERSPIEMLITTNSLPIPERIRNHPKIRVVSIAPLLADAIRQNDLSH
jgi:ribose-phosphate pyrophosphokinase